MTVAEDLLRLIHHSLPLERIRSSEPTLLQQSTLQGATAFATAIRVYQLGECLKSDFFLQTEDAYGLQACHLEPVKEGLQKYLHERAAAYESSQNFSVSLKWTEFSMTEEEVERLCATVTALRHVRWQWISAWIYKFGET